MDVRYEDQGRCPGGLGPVQLAMAAAFDLDRTLSALADPTRRRVVDLLRSRPRRAGEIAEALWLFLPAMSRHLRVLRTHGLVEEKRDASDARARVYQLRLEPIDELSAWITEVQRFWDDQLESFRRRAEEKAREKHRGKKKGARDEG